jgi:hypothetical protein
MSPTPWIGLAALIAMFLIPFLPDWLFEGPRSVKHWPRRQICSECGAPWTDGHMCTTDAPRARRPLHGELRRLTPARQLERWETRTVNPVVALRHDGQIGELGEDQPV